MFEIETLTVLLVEGWEPYQGWSATESTAPAMTGGRVTLRFPGGKTPEVWPGLALGVRPPAGGKWFNPESGWFCLGELEPGGDSVTIEVAKDTALSLFGLELRSIWLRPKNWRDIAELPKFRERRSWSPMGFWKK